jgi:putative endonuclease
MAGESLAVVLLRNHHYKIIARNYRTRLGEIDIIAKDKDCICFIEVKTRSSYSRGLPVESISFSKQRQIARVALGYLKEHRLLNQKARFDVVSVDYNQVEPKVELLKNAFELDESFTY